jgi:hypothetical protein
MLSSSVPVVHPLVRALRRHSLTTNEQQQQRSAKIVATDRNGSDRWLIAAQRSVRLMSIDHSTTNSAHGEHREEGEQHTHALARSHHNNTLA